ncbi:MAG: DUF488 family protein [Actinomycetales bacterium]|nr:DUF488 family protein [Actinomycetales bacterium]
MIAIKRVYQDAGEDGYRVLVDRVWPRGIHKDAVDLWLKDVGPSTELRTWFGHVPQRYEEFTRRYVAELDENPAVDELREVLSTHKHVTLVYGAKDTEHNQARVLSEYLER